MNKEIIDQEDSLRRTLELVGIDDPKYSIISHGFYSEERKETHKQTNDLIKICLEKNVLGDCIHITGEMRALTDPFHRYLCDEINQRDKEVFRVIYNLPEDHMRNSTTILEWNLESWNSDREKRKWYEELRTIYSIANRSVNLYALDTSNEIQYSVFGNEYILLQEKHEDKTENKHTWLLKSESLNSELTNKAIELVNRATDIDESNYRKFTKDINSIASKRYLSILAENQNTHIEKLLLDDVANDFTDSPNEIIEALRVMDFINIKCSEFLEITQSGREFITK